MRSFKTIESAVGSENLNISNKKRSGKYYHWTQPSQRKSIRDGGQSDEMFHLISIRKNWLSLMTTSKNPGMWSRGQTQKFVRFRKRHRESIQWNYGKKKKIPYQEKEADIQMQALKILNKHNQTKTSPWYIIIKMSKTQCK